MLEGVFLAWIFFMITLSTATLTVKELVGFELWGSTC